MDPLEEHCVTTSEPSLSPLPSVFVVVVNVILNTTSHFLSPVFSSVSFLGRLTFCRGPALNFSSSRSWSP